MKIPHLLKCAALFVSITPLSLHAADSVDSIRSGDPATLLRRQIRQQQLKLERLQNRIAELEQRVAGPSLDRRQQSQARLEKIAIKESTLPAAGFDRALLAQAPSALGDSGNAAGAAASQMPPAPAAGRPADTASSAVAQANSARTPSQVQATAITSTQGIPLFEQKFSFEQGLTYTHYDKRSLVLSGFLALNAVLLGKVNLQQSKTDQFQYDLTGRWNLTERVSADINLPVVYRTSNYISPGAGNAAAAFSDQSNHTGGLGDINAGVYYQLPKAKPEAADWIANARIKAPSGRSPFGIKLRENTDPGNTNLVVPARQPTGNGVWSTSVGIAFLKTLDPIVMFANLGYNYNFKRSFSDVSSSENTPPVPGDVRLGNAWLAGAGMALALNDKASVSLSYAQSVQRVSRLRATGQDWVRQVGSDSNSATFNTGLTYQLAKNLSMVSSLAIGLTPDSPNFSVGVKFPYAF